jgi:hypothetical protein
MRRWGGKLAVLAAAAALGVLTSQVLAAPSRAVGIPTLTVPTVTVTTPQVTVTTPTVTTPKVTVTTPTVTTPKVTVTTPTVTTPTVTAPKVTVTTPTVTTPKVTVTTPTVTTPRATVTTPTVGSSTVSAPKPPPAPGTPPAPGSSPAPAPGSAAKSGASGAVKAVSATGSTSRSGGTTHGSAPASSSAPSHSSSGGAAPAQSTTSAGGASAGGAHAATPRSGTHTTSAVARKRAIAALRARPRTTTVVTERTTTGRKRVRLHVVVRRPGKLRIVVTGPAPACSTAGMLRVKARRGGNDILFGGRIRGKRLRPGLYALTPTFGSTTRPGATSVVVRVGPRGGVVAVGRGGRTFACRPVVPPPQAPAASSGGGTALFADGLATGAGLGLGVPATHAPRSAQSEPGLTPTKRGSSDTSDALGAIATKLAPTRLGHPFDWTFNAVVIAVTFFGMLVFATLVVKFMRGTWNP